jgi:hypothetical protein
MIIQNYKHGEIVRLLENKVGLPLKGKTGKILGEPRRAHFDPDYYVYFVLVDGYSIPFTFFDDEIKRL